MVKVKVFLKNGYKKTTYCFNHPMVKVKVMQLLILMKIIWVSTTLWWKLKLRKSDMTDARYCFNHPMVKVKVASNASLEDKIKGFNHPMVKVKVSDSMYSFEYFSRFNHPMVKVKVFKKEGTFMSKFVSTTLWWKLKCEGHGTQTC